MFAKQRLIPPLDLTIGWAVVVLLLVLPALYVELTGDFPGRVIFYGQEEDSWFAGLFLDAHATILAEFASAFQAVQNFFA